MDYLLKFLIKNLRTIDGMWGTAENTFNLLNAHIIKEYKKKLNRYFISESMRLKLI